MYPGYTYIKNSVAQTWAATLQPGSIVANNIIVSGNSLVVANCGTYMIDLTVIGTAGTVSSTIIPTISVNGVAPTAVNTQYEIKAVLSLKKGDY